MASVVKFLNHSCVEIRSDKTTILCDPWFKGKAFGDGWSLLAENTHDINQLEFDYIWISHEHPDHFSIATIKSLQCPAHFLFQDTVDKKVRVFLEKNGHAVTELPNKKLVQIGDLKLTSIVCDGFDSSLIVNFPNGQSLLNINDARVDIGNHLENEIVAALDGTKLTLLMLQFSYANWAGNEGDNLIPKYQQEMVDKKNDYVIKTLKPEAVMMFASFVYFSHVENYFWNEFHWVEHAFKKISDVAAMCILPSPDQRFVLGSLYKDKIETTNRQSRKYWAEKLRNIKPLTETNSVSLDELKCHYANFIKRIHTDNSIFRSKIKGRNYFLKLTITDLNCSVSIGLLEEKFEILKLASSETAMDVSSEILQMLLTQPFARGTIAINSRVRFDYDLAHKFFIFFFIFYANNIGIYFHEFNTLSYEKLKSISRTAVMDSILQVKPRSSKLLEDDITCLLSCFSTNADDEPDTDIFNQEPQNPDM